MPRPKPEPLTLPPDSVRYLQGAPAESRQFDFLIGEWDVAATRYKPDGTVLLEYRASWTAQHLNAGRMVLDDFKAQLPSGEACSSYVTLRTYCETTGRWEMSGLAALQSAAPAQWTGHLLNKDMLLEAVGTDPTGSTVRNRIRFFNIERDTFEWESQLSLDDGKTWTRAATLLARRNAGPLVA